MDFERAQIPKMKLLQAFTAIEPEYVLGTTFTLSLAFFESVVFPKIRRGHLKRCLILCDPFGLQMAMSEAPALRCAARDYMVATAPSAGTFHAKVWLFLSKTEMVLLVGSGNLTQPGFIDNIELFDIARITAGETGREIAADVLAFLRGLSELWHEQFGASLLALQTLREMIGAASEIEARLKPSVEPALRFLSSFGGAFPEQLAPLRPKTLYVASPYFGNSTASLERLRSALGVQRTYVFPSLHKDAKLDLPVGEASRLAGVEVGSLAVAAAHPKKFAHLKLYGLQSAARQAWLFTGSVNCTLAAMDGPNIEAGLLRRVAADDLHTYFKGTALASGESVGHVPAYPAASGWLVIWATDVGDQVCIQLAAAHHIQAPLSEVVVEVRSGQRAAQAELVHAFRRGGTEQVAWRLFGDFRAQLRNTAVVRVSAIDAQGRSVAGQCLIDDFATLTSDLSIGQLGVRQLHCLGLRASRIMGMSPRFSVWPKWQLWMRNWINSLRTRPPL